MNVRETQLAHQLSLELEKRNQLRRQEQSLRGMGMGTKVLGNDQQGILAQTPYTLPPTIQNPCSIVPGNGCPPNALRDSLEKFLPPELMPGNVGAISQSAWFFLMPANFTFGTNPVLTSAVTQTVNLTVPKDGGFLLLNTCVAADDFSPAGLGGPYQVLIQDNQSAQQFMNNPVPLQMFAYKSYERQMVTPMYFAPSATIGVTVNTWLQRGVNVPTVGSGNIQILLIGLLTYINGDSDVLSNVYSQR